MTRKIHELTPQELLTLAISLERSNFLSLKAFSQYFEGRHELDTAFKFIELASEEIEHEALLLKKYEALYGTSPSLEVQVDLDEAEKKFHLEFMKDAKFDEFDRAQKVFELALIAENRAKDYYRRASMAAQNQDLAGLFNSLGEMESDHVGWLEKKIQEEKSKDPKGLSGSGWI